MVKRSLLLCLLLTGFIVKSMEQEKQSIKRAASSAEPSSKKQIPATIILITQEEGKPGERIKINKKVAEQSNTLMHILSDTLEREIPISAPADVVKPMIGLMQAMADSHNKAIARKAIIEEITYLNPSFELALSLLLLVNYLDIQPLIEPLSQTLVGLWGKEKFTPEETRQKLSLIPKDLHPLLARWYFLKTGASFGFTEGGLPLVNPQSYGFSIVELLIYNRLDIAARLSKDRHTLDLSNLGINSLDGLDKIEDPRLIRSLNLSSNQLTVLPSHSFAPLINLSRLDLSNNKITEIAQTAFVGLGLQLAPINLSGNPISQALKDELLKRRTDIIFSTPLMQPSHALFMQGTDILNR